MKPPSAPQPKKPIVRLVKWSVHPDNPFIAPEQGGGIHLSGYAFGHPKAKAGEHLSTGTIVRVDGRIAYSGSTEYRLGRIDPKYRKWLRKNGIAFDQDRPIKVRREQS